MYKKWAEKPKAVGGQLGGGFSRALIAGTERVAPWMARYPYRVAAACGFAIALFGFLSGETTYGTGYDEAKGILTQTHAAGMLYPVFKLLATIASYLSGIPGGIFAPSLAAGAGLGADLAHVFPFAPAAAVIILGMVSYFSGVVQTPITAFVIVMEMMGNHTMLLPLMAASFIAYGTSRFVCPEPIYRVLARRFVRGEPMTAASASVEERAASTTRS